MLFGSAAHGSMSPGSDIDVFVVAADDRADDPIWRHQSQALEQQATSWTGNDTRVLEYSLSDLGRGPDAVVEEIRNTGIHIAGDRAVLRSAAKVRS